MLDIHEIQRLIPHRYPFLLIDRILEMELGKRIVGIKNVTINEPYFVGHFPGYPVMPGVLILESMAQAGGVLIKKTLSVPDGELMFFMGIDRAKFRKPVFPGDQLRLELEVLSLHARYAKVRGKAFVEGNLVAEAELTTMIVGQKGQGEGR
ncbi:MAG: 3-hydroxyacyl-ACP dehydratase FabZ [candidate division NC10 bacterium]|nr:3-hydroxyacyl-ACP dehydratase FabZ [candidate division NC10 bacterium]